MTPTNDINTIVADLDAQDKKIAEGEERKRALHAQLIATTPDVKMDRVTCPSLALGAGRDRRRAERALGIDALPNASEAASLP